MDQSNIQVCLTLFLMLIFSAFFSACETAISSVNKIRLKNRAEAGDKRAAQVLRQAEDYERTLSTILVGNNVVNLSMSSLATILFCRMLDTQIGPTVSTIVMTFLVLIFGEILPKGYAKENAEKSALTFAPVLGIFRMLLYPFVSLFVLLQKVANSRHPGEDTPTVTGEELKTIIDTVEEEGVLDERESDIIQSAIDLEEEMVQEILVPRVDIVALSIDATRKEILSTVQGCSFTRIPLYEGTIDHCVGMLHTRDLLNCLTEGKPIVLRELAREILFVYRTKKVGDLLTEFRRTQQHIAIVTDDHGGTLGMVTLEDVLEELVGEIFDETEVAQPSPVRTLEPNLYLVEGDLKIDDLFEAIDYQRPRDMEPGEYTSVAGWALDCLAHIPAAGERFTFDTLQGTVAEMDGKRIVSLIIRKQ